MKRLDEIVERASENLGFKKPRTFSAINVLERAQEEEETTEFSDNRMIDSSGTDAFYGNDPTGDFGYANLGGFAPANEWDFDINFDLIFGKEREHNGSGFDLNDPVGMLEGRTNMGIQKENRAVVINILSDDSDDEVEIIGFNHGYGTNITRQLEINMMAAESSEVAGCEMGYPGQKTVEGNLDGSWWLSPDKDYPFASGFWTDCDLLPREGVEVEALQPAESPAMSEVAELDLTQFKGALRPRATPNRVVPIKTARRFARIIDPNENTENETATQEKRGQMLKFAEQLGKSLGPFSEAFKIAKERTLKGAAQGLVEWKPSEENQEHYISAPLVPSLLNLSSKALAENAEGIVSLELVPDVLRKKLADMLCDTSRMNVHVLKHFVEGCPTEIRIKNCSWLTEKQFQQTVGNCQTSNLRVLQLDLCGQVMLDVAIRDSLAQSADRFSSLAILSLRGACRLSDSGLKELLAAAPALCSINLGHCNLLTSGSINFIANFSGSNLRELYIDGCQNINTNDILLPFKKFRYLEVLSVADIQNVTDRFIDEVITVCGRSIKELDLANCLELTDCSLIIIGSSCAGLRSLNISNLHNLTDLGMEYLAHGCRSIQKLKLCGNRFSDEAVAAFLESSGEFLTELSLNNVTKAEHNTALSLAHCAKNLSSLDISWCRRITNEALGLIVDSCSALKLLRVFGCRQITSVFVNGHSNPLVRIIGLSSTPILENIDLLEPEEVLLRYSPLPILGIEMQH